MKNMPILCVCEHRLWHWLYYSCLGVYGCLGLMRQMFITHTMFLSKILLHLLSSTTFVKWQLVCPHTFPYWWNQYTSDNLTFLPWKSFGPQYIRDRVCHFASLFLTMLTHKISITYWMLILWTKCKQQSINHDAKPANIPMEVVGWLRTGRWRV